MGEKEALMSELGRFKERLNHDFAVEKMLLFGSYATGNVRSDSDVNLIIVSRRFKGMNFIRRAAKMYDYWTLDKPVDFLCYTPDEFRRIGRGVSIVSEALKNGAAV